MATLVYYLDRRSVKKDGTSPLKAMVNVRKDTLLFPIGIDLLPTQWNNDKKMIVKHPRKAFLNSFLNEMTVKAEETLMTEQKKTGQCSFKDPGERPHVFSVLQLQGTRRKCGRHLQKDD